jgi:exodeoxyribonuclease-3
MKIATWNVNSVRTREPRLLAWLERRRPDVVCLQELKAEDEQFPWGALRALGYDAAVNGQKTYNGVAVLSRSEPPEAVEVGLADGLDDSEARLLAATVAGLRVVCAYAPNGQTVESDKYQGKREWLTRLSAYVRRALAAGRPVVVCGDLNIAPEPIDVARIDEWRGTVLFNDEMTRAFHALLEAGLVDVFRRHHPEAGLFSWWDYRRLGFQKNNGLRIDHILATPDVAERSRDALVDREERKGDKPSDHAPVIADFEWPP